MRGHDPSHARGIDVSSWQGGNIDWQAVRVSGQVDFAIIKATEGTDWNDPTYAPNISGAKTAGLITGAYHFARPDSAPGDAAAEAAHFIAVVKAGPAEPDFLALDLETTQLGAADTTAWALAWLQAVQAAFPSKRVLLYTYVSFARSSIDATQLASWPLAIAHYGVNQPAEVPGWSDWTVWQFSDAGSVPGIQGAVDLDEFAGTPADLAAWAAGSSGGAATGSPAPSPVQATPAPAPQPATAGEKGGWTMDICVQAQKGTAAGDAWVGRHFQLSEFACAGCGQVRVTPGFIKLVALLDAMREEAGVPCRVTSGYRCPEHNAQVAGAVQDSQHIEGVAADIVLVGLAMPKAQALAEKYFGDGGIGVYKDGHLHVDLGPKRRWNG